MASAYLAFTRLVQKWVWFNMCIINSRTDSLTSVLQCQLKAKEWFWGKHHKPPTHCLFQHWIAHWSWEIVSAVCAVPAPSTPQHDSTKCKSSWSASQRMCKSSGWVSEWVSTPVTPLSHHVLLNPFSLSPSTESYSLSGVTGVSGAVPGQKSGCFCSGWYKPPLLPPTDPSWCVWCSSWCFSL